MPALWSRKIASLTPILVSIWIEVGFRLAICGSQSRDTLRMSNDIRAALSCRKIADLIPVSTSFRLTKNLDYEVTLALSSLESEGPFPKVALGRKLRSTKTATMGRLKPGMKYLKLTSPW